MATTSKKMKKASTASIRPTARLALPAPDAPDYFDELLKRVQEIRVSEKRLYRQVTDIYATSVDYDADAEGTWDFFATVQNKMHHAVTGHSDDVTLRLQRQDHALLLMGSDAPEDGVLLQKAAEGLGIRGEVPGIERFAGFLQPRAVSHSRHGLWIVARDYLDGDLLVGEVPQGVGGIVAHLLLEEKEGERLQVRRKGVSLHGVIRVRDEQDPQARSGQFGSPLQYLDIGRFLLQHHLGSAEDPTAPLAEGLGAPFASRGKGHSAGPLPALRRRESRGERLQGGIARWCGCRERAQGLRHVGLGGTRRLPVK